VGANNISRATARAKTLDKSEKVTILVESVDEALRFITPKSLSMEIIADANSL
jgi:hypothetical protein